jgi:hypothetical protein
MTGLGNSTVRKMINDGALVGVSCQKERRIPIVEALRILRELQII